MCANSLDTDVYCEKCIAAAETEDFVAAQSNKLNKTEIDLVLSKHAGDKETGNAGVTKRKDTAVPL